MLTFNFIDQSWQTLPTSAFYLLSCTSGRPAILPPVTSRAVVSSILFFGLLAFSSLASGQGPESGTKPDRIVAVSSLTLKQTSSFEVKRQFSGQIEARRRSHLGFDRIGQIAEIFVDRGDEVTAGQLIASLDVDALRAQRHKLEADLRSAEAQLREAKAGPRRETIATARANLQEQQTQWDLAKESLQRRENLFKKKFIAREELDQAQAANARWSAVVDGATSQLNELLEGTRQERIDAQAAQVQSIEAAVAQVNVELQKSQIFAPYDGKVLMREVDEGSVVSPGQSVVSIVEYRKLEAKIGVSPVFAKKIAKGQALDVECNGIKLPGTVQAIVSEVDVNTRTQAVIVSLDEHAWEQVTAGDTVRVNFAQKEKSSGFWVPTESLVAGPRGLWNCFVIENIKDGVGTTAVRTVELIHSDGDRSMISGPLQAGETIVAAAPHRIIAGQSVRTVTSAESP